MSPRRTHRILGALCVLSLVLTACNVGQGVKKLGTKKAGGTGNNVTDADTFSVTLAYRNPSETTPAGRRLVSIQGVRDNAQANFVNECGATGTNCICEFFQNSTSSAIQASSVGLSSQNNSFSCVIPDSVTDAQITNGFITLVKLRRADDPVKNTGLLAIKTTLTLEDILGTGTELVKSKVRGVFRYTCGRTFFEGQGVQPTQITCLPAQQLGVIQATYHFYIFRSGEDSNQPGGDSPFPSDVCKRNDFLKVQCTGNTPELRYGLYKESKDPFVVGIQMARAPEGENRFATYGFAALPDSAGNCPTGLVKIRPYLAQPQSIIQGSLGSNPTSNFINTNNSLNDTIMEQEFQQNQIPTLTITRQPNLVPCDLTTGDCTNAVFGGVSVAQAVAYTPLTPVVCAIPSNLLNGVF